MHLHRILRRGQPLDQRPNQRLYQLRAQHQCLRLLPPISLDLIATFAGTLLPISFSLATQTHFLSLSTTWKLPVVKPKKKHSRLETELDSPPISVPLPRLWPSTLADVHSNQPLHRSRHRLRLHLFHLKQYFVSSVSAAIQP